MRWPSGGEILIVTVAILFIAGITNGWGAVRLADANPAPGIETYIEDNRITLTFGEAVIPVSITVTDAQGRVVSTGKTEGTDHDIDVVMKAPDRSGYACGYMTVVWHVKAIEGGEEARGVYSFFVKPHFNSTCTHQYRP